MKFIYCIQQLQWFEKINQGLWAWMTNQFLTAKFWKGVQQYGWIKTYTRAHKVNRHSHDIGGALTPAHYMGRDQFGNRYYQDWNAHYFVQTRYVQYADYFKNQFRYGDRVPPKWHGWLSHQYDQVPELINDPNFIEPIYLKQHICEFSGSPYFYMTPEVVANPKFLQYRKYRKQRYSKPWVPQTRRK